MAVEVFLERASMLREWRKWSEKRAVIVREILADAEVYVIGSVARGEAVAASDLDILVVSEKIPDNPRERSKLKAVIEERARLPLHHPIQLHLVKPGEKKRYLGHSRYIRLV